MIDQLSEHFSLAEMTFSSTGQRLGINNEPTPDVLQNLIRTARRMEEVRALFEEPIHVDSGYRGYAVNVAVGGVPTSAHCFGYAVDFTIPGYDNHEVACAIADSSIMFDQLILEYGWIHISFDPQNRRELLTKKSASSPYVTGLVR